ncbi:MAG TPA: hypothetical protein VGP90_08095 [Acidimicrobiia bacterium]|jgi:hypothetical protein|nr:hypothetical protein [Acidimicrobiia bacterium]
MTDDQAPPTLARIDDQALPTLVRVSQAFSQRLPTQRVQDTLTRLEGGTMGELLQTQPFRVVAFRALLRDHPDRDPTSLWLHAYDVEVEVVEADPTNGSSPTPAPPSAATPA